jgi:hypothetical protein
MAYIDVDINKFYFVFALVHPKGALDLLMRVYILP